MKVFFIKNVTFKPFGSSTRISGEIMNKSDRGYGMIDFKVQAYNEENVFLGWSMDSPFIVLKRVRLKLLEK